MSNNSIYQDARILIAFLILMIVPFFFRFLNQIANATRDDPYLKNKEWGSLHLVGHSLGAHICGFICHNLKRIQDKWIIRRVTGLDPAQPCFTTDDPAMKLDRTDAEYVDVIHTNGRLLSRLGLGLPTPIGQVHSLYA